MKRIAVLLSNKGKGSNLAAILKAIKTGKIKNGRVVVVVSDKADAYGLVRARKKKIPTEVFSLKNFLQEGKTRRDYDRALGQLLKEKYQVDLVVLAGWMLILSKEFLRFFPLKTINLHPGLLPDEGEDSLTLLSGEKIKAIRGLAVEKAVEFALKNHYPATGSTVHFVTEKVDEGPVILRSEIKILPQDTVESLYARMKKAEHKILPQAIAWFCEDKLVVKKGKVFLKN